MSFHVFVAMPFGVKDGIDFNKVYGMLIKPALEGAGFEVFRADEEIRAGNIRTDMFQELLLADLVVADLSIDNPNVWYELGVRHGLRARGVIQIQCKRDYMPFDVYSDRTLKYHIKNGEPDKDYEREDKEALSRMAIETMRSWRGYRVSPVYHLLPYLQEPDWKTLRTSEAAEFWQKQEDWERRIEVAQKKQRPGDILVYADEAPIRTLRLEAFISAGRALMKLGQYKYALVQIEKALEIEPQDVRSLQLKGILLGRLEKYVEAEELLKDLVRKRPDDAETLALLGRTQKDSWVRAWRKPAKTARKMRDDAASNVHLLREAIQPYLNGFLQDPRHYYSGINALTLIHVLKHLTAEDAMPDRRIALEGGVRWAASGAISKETVHCRDYWARVTLGDLEVLIGGIKDVDKAYGNAAAAAEKDWFALDSSLQQLKLLRDLGFRESQVKAGIDIFESSLKELRKPEGRQAPRTVFLFSGHMVDKPGRPEPRFPADKEETAARRIAASLEELGANREDLAFCGGACGGDLLFAKICLEKGLKLEVRIPFAEPGFLLESVTFAGIKWRDLFYEVKSHPRTNLYIMPEELGPPPGQRNPFERNNLWQLYTALSYGADKVRFICLWDKKGGDGPGGTKHMHDTVREHFGQVYVIDTNTL